MGIGLSGLVSGMDTDSLIKQLMSAERTRVTKVDNKITKNEWKVEKWKSLNSKIYSLYTGSLSKMRMQGSYLAKKTTSSNDKVVTVKAGSNAPIGTHQIKVKSVAASQYVTGAAITTASGNRLTSKSKLVGADGAGMKAGTRITMSCGGKTQEFVVEADSTITDFINAGKEAGLNINFDESRQTFYINSKQSGTENTFTITTDMRNETYVTAQSKLKELVDYTSLSADDKKKFDEAFAVIDANKDNNFADIDTILATDDASLGDDKKALKKAYNDIAALANKKTANELAKKELAGEVKGELTDAINGANGRALPYTNYGKTFKATDWDAVKADAHRTAKTKFETKVREDVELVHGVAFKNEVLTANGVTETEIDNIRATAEDARTQEQKDKLAAFDAAYKSKVDAKVSEKLATYYDETNKVYKDTIEVDGNVVQTGYANIYADELSAHKLDTTERFGAEAAASEAAKTVVQGKESAILADTSSHSTEFNNLKAELRTALTTVAGQTAFVSDPSTPNALSAIGLVDITDDMARGTGTAQYATGTGTSSNVTLSRAADAEVELNGATIISSSNTITANGLTIEALSASEETVSVTVTQNTDSVYDMVKQFVKDYNEVLEEMNKAYYAESARGYNPLTDEQKDAMSDTEVEKWETKIKDSLLRRDNTLGSLITSMRSVLNEAVEVDGKKYSFASFGITTTKYTEKGKLHIYGDQDDPEGMTYDDKLRKAIEEDPEKVMEVLQTISKKLYDTLNDKMKATELSSALTFYNDKELTKEMNNYKKEKTKEEKRLQAIEDRYYKQFAAMEKALGNLSSQANTLLQMLGQQYNN